MPDTGPLDPPGPFAVFCATTENLGLSTTLRNVADVLAAGNRSVLLVDGRTGAEGGHEPVPEPEPGRVAAVRRPAPETLLELPADSRAARYDHVLVEAPLPDAPGASTARLAALADTLVACFAMTAWSIDGAAALAEQLRDERAGRPTRLLALGLKSNVEVHDRLRGARERVRDRFRTIAGETGARNIPFLEIPYHPLYLDTRRLAVESEPAGSVTGLRPYYERLADWLRDRRTRPLTTVTLVHQPRHAAWAAWLEERFRRCGIGTELRREDTYTGDRPAPGTALLFLSPGAMDAARLEQLAALSHPDVRVVLVDEPFSDNRSAHHERIDLRGADEQEALRLLHGGLGLGPVPPSDGAAARVRFPRLPDVTNVAPRSGEFLGRDDLLEQLQGRLRAAGRDRLPVVLHADGGWGKSETARELCHRFGPGYDLVWWVRAWEPTRARRGLARLAERLGVTVPAEGPLTALFEHLADPATGSWLVVYDGAVDHDALRDLLPVPHDRGHVLLTSRTVPEGTATAVLDLPRLSPAECRALLRERLPDIDDEQSRQVGQVLGHVALALRLASFCLAERAAAHLREDHMSQEAAARAAVGDILAEYRTAQEALLDRDSVAPHVAVMVRVARQTALRTPGAAAWRAESPDSDAVDWVLDATSLLTGRGMGLGLLLSRRVLSELSGDDTAPGGEGPDAHRPPDDVRLPDEHMIGVALWSLARVGLVEVDFDRPEQPLGQHHVLRDLLRAGLDPERRARIERVLRSVLAEYAPDEDRGLPAHWAREVYSLRLWEDTRPRVRRSLLRHLNTLAGRGESADRARLLDISAHAARSWAPTGDDPTPEYLRLLGVTARAHRTGGSYDQARGLAEQALRGHRRLLGTAHPRTLLSADSYGAVLRSLGRFTDALVQARPVLEGLTLLLGPHHPATVQVEHNLALTEALTGRYTTALGRLLERFRYRQTVGGEDDPVAWLRADLLAWVYRTLGRDAESQDLLRQWLRRHGDTPTQDRLSVEMGLAVSERRLASGAAGTPEAQYGLEKALERDRRVLAEYTARFGATHLGSLRCRFGLAADLHLLGKDVDAELESRQCAEVLEETLGAGHPFAALARVQHAVHLRTLRQTDEAEATGRAALNLLADRLGSGHPWMSAAENSLAATLAATGRREEAAALARAALTRLEDLGMGHRPDGRLVRAHLARLTGDPAAEQTSVDMDMDIDLELPGL
ncbi:FxSxx-COOH system tetratricopeptide repeat protein [Streptomyces sp. NPDC008150]|uniref:FxSxx-COOH system tetratricopeptide repeat protein n=1 Tax=Streptomyces sp. NPDC008150 TaxID=3364816 RepID=UPI0036EA2E27